MKLRRKCVGFSGHWVVFGIPRKETLVLQSPRWEIRPIVWFLNGCGVLLDLRAVKECRSKRKGNNGADEQSTPNSRFILLVMLRMQIPLAGSTGDGDLPGSLLIQVASGYRTGQVPLSLKD